MTPGSLKPTNMPCDILGSKSLAWTMAPEVTRSILMERRDLACSLRRSDRNPKYTLHKNLQTRASLVAIVLEADTQDMDRQLRTLSSSLGCDLAVIWLDPDAVCRGRLCELADPVHLKVRQ
jgi:hypothetical protein